MEMIGGKLAAVYGDGSGTIQVASAFEETLELLGVSVFLTLLLRQMRGLQFVGR